MITDLFAFLSDEGAKEVEIVDDHRMNLCMSTRSNLCRRNAWRGIFLNLWVYQNID